MGKRKSSKPPPKKQRPKLDVAFNCPFCNSNKSVSAIMDWDSEVGSVSCNICGERFNTKIHKLSEAIDVYSEWIDECEAANE
ncbi:probable transcription elongation factor 1 homolog [Coccomyxa sp. Obi]|nr:probable transcription elongation factor 1 homolog [Coccomyxa sp. Obi]